MLCLREWQVIKFLTQEQYTWLGKVRGVVLFVYRNTDWKPSRMRKILRPAILKKYVFIFLCLKRNAERVTKISICYCLLLTQHSLFKFVKINPSKQALSKKNTFPNYALYRNTTNNIYLLQLGCHPVAVVILHVNKTWNWLLLNLSREGYMRSM